MKKLKRPFSLLYSLLVWIREAWSLGESGNEGASPCRGRETVPIVETLCLHPNSKTRRFQTGLPEWSVGISETEITRPFAQARLGPWPSAHIQLAGLLGAAGSSRQYPTDNRMISFRHRAGISLESSLRLFQTWHPSWKTNVSGCLTEVKGTWILGLPHWGKWLSFTFSKCTWGEWCRWPLTPSSL